MFAQSSPETGSPESGLTAGPLPTELWPEYESFFSRRSETRPLPPRAGCEPIGVFDGDTLIAACGLYDTAGPFTLAEALAVDPKLSPRASHAAVSALLAELDRLAHERSKVICGWSGDHEHGLAAIARRLGIATRAVTVVACNAEQMRGAS